MRQPGKLHLDLQINSKVAILNGREVELAAAATIVNGSTLVPLRFIGEAFGAEVIWNAEDRSVDIKKWIYPESQDEPEEKIEDEVTLTYDDPTFTTYKAETYHLEGNLVGHTLNANYVEAEIFQKFKTSVVLNDAPSFTPAIIEITDKDGNELESYTLNIENGKNRFNLFKSTKDAC
ncbi:MAG: copper amine oxidase N-terminal domain-containing protein [Caldisericia bacterium]